MKMKAFFIIPASCLLLFAATPGLAGRGMPQSRRVLPANKNQQQSADGWGPGEGTTAATGSAANSGASTGTSTGTSGANLVAGGTFNFEAWGKMTEAQKEALFSAQDPKIYVLNALAAIFSTSNDASDALAATRRNYFVLSDGSQLNPADAIAPLGKLGAEVFSAGAFSTLISPITLLGRELVALEGEISQTNDFIEASDLSSMTTQELQMFESELTASEQTVSQYQVKIGTLLGYLLSVADPSYSSAEAQSWVETVNNVQEVMAPPSTSSSSTSSTSSASNAIPEPLSLWQSIVETVKSFFPSLFSPTDGAATDGSSSGNAATDSQENNNAHQNDPATNGSGDPNTSGSTTLPVNNPVIDNGGSNDPNDPATNTNNNEENGTEGATGGEGAAP